ncbi:aspartyl/asparaginyl beta-hydroxylase domain-containing protein [Novosphingobium sp. KCTC 2891]|nr:aspartyl/asparaginyl beta-hydroxylase domain-containing protein [Novosphingobium sp. KCTC 2891]
MTPDQLIAEGIAALRARNLPRAAECLRAAAVHASAAMPWPALAQVELALGRPAAAEDALDRQLAQAPRDVGALLAKGQLRQQGRDDRAAVSFYRTALAQAAVSGIPRGLEALAGQARAFIGETDRAFTAHLKAEVGTDLSPAMAEAIELLTGERQLYLQQPSVFYFPGLPQRRFYDPSEFPWLAAVLELLPRMKNELAQVLADTGTDAFTPYVTAPANRPAPNNPLLGKADWGAYYFWKDGAPVEQAVTRCPATMEALSHAPMPMIPGRAPMALWSRLRPGTHIAPHHGMLNTRLICHVPIRPAPGCTLRVGSDVRSWEEGVPLLFDDSIEHEARNDGPEERVVLLFEIWRPEIGEADRAAIARIFQAIGGYGEEGI